MNIFDEGSPVLRFLNRVTDLLVLNLLALLMCLPVITAGASLTAMHYVLLKLVRDEEGYIAKSFFRSFKRNFLQATVIWLIFAALWVLTISNLVMIVQGSGKFPIWLPAAVLFAALILLVVMLYTFAMLSRYDNTILQMLFNACSLAFSRLPQSLEMLAILVVPAILVMRFPVLMPFYVLFGLSAPGYACAMVYDPIFRKIEKQMGEEEQAQEPEE